MDYTNGLKLELATGTSRRAKNWKNTTTTWPELVQRLSATTRTAETLAEYRAMGREEQASIKDVGGFVGGYLQDGKRTRVASRSLLTLDADYALPDFADRAAAALDSLRHTAGFIYSTHKHTPEKPRLRLVVPLARPVSPDEYQAIGRKVAELIGIEEVDDTSYQPQRLMYWPSTSKDGEYYAREIVGGALNPDEVLALYRDWRDVSAWPMSSRVASVVRKTAEKQQDPTTKPGLVGAFCRAYGMAEAIAAFIPDYLPTADPTRYTYAQGSTACGVIVYDDKYCYSHHATDPASGQLCNAWDAVRLHRFGQLDEDTDPDTPPSKRHSWRAMAELVQADPQARAQLVSDRVAAAQEDFTPAEQPADWHALLRVTDKGAIAATIENAVIILQHDERLAGRLAYNEMTHNIVIRGALPWRTPAGATAGWIDADDSALRLYLEKYYGISGKDKIFDAVQVTAQGNAYHPVRDYLDGCSWDGVQRVERLLVDYLGAADTPYTRAVTRKTLAAAVARIYEPGCKFDFMLTLRGRQGLGKSTLISRLGGQWYSDSIGTMQGKESYEQVQGVWIIEVGELAGMRKAEAETIKLYISKQSDRFRPAYGRRLQDFPRQCIFIGSTNESQFLRDSTGNRRFWVVDTPGQPAADVWDALTPDEVAQLWAEAVQLYRAGEPLYLDRELEEAARQVQADYEEENPQAGLVAAYLDRLLPEDWPSMDLYSRRQWLSSPAVGTVRRRNVCTFELWAEALGQPESRMDRYASKELRAIMERLPGWERGSSTASFSLWGTQRYYRRVNE